MEIEWTGTLLAIPHGSKADLKLTSPALATVAQIMGAVMVMVFDEGGGEMSITTEVGVISIGINPEGKVIDLNAAYYPVPGEAP